MIAPFLTTLLEKIADLTIDKWKSAKEFQQMQSVAYERISRELFWNAECLSRADDNKNIGYLGLIRTQSFDELVLTGIPMDALFSQTISFADDLNGNDYPALSKQYVRRLKDINSLSMLIDRTYHRLWMLQKRCDLNLPKGDIPYARSLVRMTNSFVANQRKKGM
jgi:hypothetical protein